MRSSESGRDEIALLGGMDEGRGGFLVRSPPLLGFALCVVLDYGLWILNYLTEFAIRFNYHSKSNIQNSPSISESDAALAGAEAEEGEAEA